VSDDQVVRARRRRAVAAAIPIVLVNSVAFGGQLSFLRAHLPWPLAGQVTMAVALESVAVFLAMHAHVAALADDSALRLRLASYGFAAVIGAMNYSHYARPGWQPTFPAVAVGLMSASSPWLWAVHSRRASRDQLRARGLVEAHALRLGATRWLWHPVRSARVMFNATWTGVTDPHEAIGSWEAASASAGKRATRSAPVTTQDARPGNAPVTTRDAHASSAQSRPRSSPATRSRGRIQVTELDVENEFMSELAAGSVPSLRQIRARMHVGDARARLLRAHLEQLASAAASAESLCGTSTTIEV
jgi:hypothetical protein